MKHPALTRVLAIVLAVFCLVMLLAGLFGLRSAAAERRRTLDDAGRLRERAAQYEQAQAALKDGTPSAKLSETLESRQKEHEKTASAHRAAMAIYTATQSGLRSGAAALDQADAMFAEGKRQLEARQQLFFEQEAAFETQYQQFQQGKQQLADFSSLYDSAAQLLANANQHAANARNLTALLESDDADARRQLTVAAYDEALAAADQIGALLESVKELTPILDAVAEMDAGSLEGLGALGELGDLGAITGQDISLPEIDPEQLSQAMELYRMLWPRVKELTQGMSERLPALEQAVENVTGKSLAALREEAQTRRNAIADGEAETVISDESFAAMQAAYGELRGAILGVLDLCDELLGNLDGGAEQIGSLLSQAQEMLTQFDAYMQQGKAGMEQGRAAMVIAGEQIRQGEQALYDGRAQLWYQMGQQRDKAARLQQEKAQLDVESEELKALEQAVEERKALEQEERSLRIMLQRRDAVAERESAGMSLCEAAALTAQELEENARTVWQGRSLAYALLIAGGILGFAGIPAAFERTKSRFLLIAPVLLCLLCALGAEGVCLYYGRGSSYSAIGGAIFSLLQLPVSLPRANKKGM